MSVLIKQEFNEEVQETKETPWPDLPKITDPTLYRLALTHKSLHSSELLNSKRVDSEILAHTGDAILQFYITCMLRNLFPVASVDEVTQIRSKLVDKTMNCFIAEHYNIPEKVKASKGAYETLQSNIREKGESWESYLGALFYCEHEKIANIHNFISNPSSSSHDGEIEFEQTFEPNFSVPETKPFRPKIQYFGQALDNLIPFLEALYIPFARQLYDPNREERKDLLETAIKSRSKASLQEYLQKYEIQNLEYNFHTNDRKANSFLPDGVEKNGNQGLLYKATCRIILNDGNVCESEGIAENIKNAESIAAYQVLEQAKMYELGGIKVMRNKKR